MPTTTPESGGKEEPFEKDAQVEVSFEEEGFRGSWYTATVLRPPSSRITSRKPRISVQFHTLTVKDPLHDTTHPLRESVDLILVRPIPPRESRRSFRVDDDVDAFHNDGWWEGIVIAVIDGGTRYSVYFRSSREQIDFPESLIRLHREWVHGKWDPPLDQNAKVDDQNAKESRVSEIN